MNLEIRATIGELAETIRGVTYVKAAARTSPREGYSPLIRATNIEQGTLVLDSFVYVPDDVIRDDQRLRMGDIVLAASSGSVSVVGKAALLRSRWAGTFGAFCYVVRPQPESVMPDYLAYFMQTSTYRNRVSKLAAGVNINNLRREHIESVDLPYCALTEQHRIVEAIDSYLSRLDVAVTRLERVQAKLRAYRASVLRAAVGGELVASEESLSRKERRDYVSAKVLLARTLKERRDAGAALAAPDTDALPELPGGWAWATVEMLSKDKQGSICAGPFGTIFKAKDFRETGIPIIFLRHVKPDRFLKKNPTFMDEGKWKELFRDYSVYGGELLVTKLGDPPGDCAVFPSSAAPSMLTPDVMKLELDERLANARYTMHYINSVVARRYAFGAAFGTTRLRLTLPLFRAMPVPLPPLPEQERIVEKVDRLLSVVDETDASIERDIRRCGRLRQSVLKWAFEGKLVDQDPTAESADKLLARIRAERGTGAPAKKTRGSTTKGAA